MRHYTSNKKKVLFLGMNILRAGKKLPAVAIIDLLTFTTISSYTISSTSLSTVYEVYKFVPNFNGHMLGLGRAIDNTKMLPVATDSLPLFIFNEDGSGGDGCYHAVLRVLKLNIASPSFMTVSLEIEDNSENNGLGSIAFYFQ